MIFECAAIIVVILVLSFMVFRSKRNSGFGIGILPLILVPAAHIAGLYLSRWMAKTPFLTRMHAYVAIDIGALVITCLCLGGISTQIKRKRTRMSYLIVCGGFAALLTCVLLIRTVLL